MGASLEVSTVSFEMDQCACSHSVLSDSLRLHGCQAPLSVGFSRQEYWSGFPFPSSEALPYPGIEPRSPALQADSLPSEPPGKPEMDQKWIKK